MDFGEAKIEQDNTHAHPPPLCSPLVFLRGTSRHSAVTTSSTFERAELRPVSFEDTTTSKRAMATGVTAKYAAARAR